MDNKRIEQLEFQMRNNDLHAQLATILDLAREDMALKGWNKKHDKIIREIIDDLMLVHNRYNISFQSKIQRRHDIQLKSLNQE